MALRIYNTQIRRKQEFTPMKKGKVKMYVCGPTVYDIAHLGHGRSAVAFDIIRRYLLYKGFEVTYVFNYTDIDDKMIKRAGEEGITVKELARKIIPEYVADYGALGIMPPTIEPHATEHIKEIIDLISRLEEKEAAYVIGDGVYFDIKTFPAYGNLSKQNIDELEVGARVEENKEKRNPQDFVLWKFKKEGEPSWQSPWGEGRPGWHIECSAMTMTHLGNEFDIHGGGVDLLFPHHEDELAQSEKVCGKQVVRYWMHNGFVNIDNEKMSKSLGNFFTLKDIFAKFDPLVVRYFLFATHYRAPVNFADTLLESAENSLGRFWEVLDKLAEYGSDAGSNKKVTLAIASAKKKFEEAMDDDFETSAALASLFDLTRELNSHLDKKDMSKADAKAALDFFASVDTVLCVLFREKEKVPKKILDLAKKRDEVRAARDFDASDKLRDEIVALGYRVDDTPSGTKVKKK